MFTFRNIDIIIGGLPPNYLSVGNNFIQSKSYDSDSLSWCIQTSKFAPKWKHILGLFPDVSVPICIWMAFLFSSFLAYIQSMYECWTYDSYAMSLKVLQLAIGNPAKLDAKTTGTRFIVTCELWGSFLLYTFLCCLYISTIHKVKKEYQIHTYQELLNDNFEMAGDKFSSNTAIEFNMVKFFFYL